MSALRVGVVYEETQMSDILGIDIIGNCSKQFISGFASLGYDQLLSKARDIEFLYISSTLEPARTTPTVRISPTHTYDTAPRDLDIILIGGPSPAHRPAGSLEFFREAFEKTKVIFTVCTGSLWLADSGVLKGKKATTNRMFLDVAKALHPEVNWLDQRWTVDESGPGAKLWIAGAAGHGMDMIATYVLQNFDPEIAAIACESIGFHPDAPHEKGQQYATPPAFPGVSADAMIAMLAQ